MPRPAALTFDLEGTLVDVEDAHHFAHWEVACSLGLTLTLPELRLAVPGFVGGGDDRVAAGVHALSGTALAMEEVQRRTKEAYLRRLATAQVAPRPGAAEFLRAAAEAGFPCALASATPRVEALELLERSGLWTFFAARPRFFREDVREPKPDPEVFHAAARALGVAPEAQLVFEDSPVGVRAARAAGAVVVAMPAIDDAALHAQLRREGAAALLPSWAGETPATMLARLG